MPTWIMAHDQTAARGRRGRAWVNPHGNFAATLVFRPGGTASEAALRSFVMALALHDTLKSVVPPGKLSLKWPNDVLLAGGKVAGILLESAGASGRADWLSIGVGINLTQAPTMAEVETGAVLPVAVSEFATARLPVEGVLFELATHFARYEQMFVTYGFDPIRRLWLTHAARLGEVVTARTGKDTHQGTMETVDEAGNLVLMTAKGRIAIPAAEIYF